MPKPLHPGKIVNAEKETTPINPPFTVNSEDDDDDEQEPPKEHEHAPDGPVPPAPRRSGRVPGETAAERMQRAVEEAKDANENDAHALIDAITLYALTADDSQLNLEHPDDPKSAKEALESSLAHEWLAAMHDELNSIKEMGVYTLVPRSAVPKGRKVMRGNFVFRTKRDFMGAVSRYKARYVLQPVPNPYESSFTLQLYGAIDETTWMEQPKGFEEPGKEDWVWER